MTSTEDQEHAEALRRAISLDRLGTYQRAANTIGADVLDLYIRDRDLSAGFLADMAIIGVALRNAMHTALSKTYGGHWYTRPDVGPDDRSEANITAAWRRLHERRPLQAPGRVVAQADARLLGQPSRRPAVTAAIHHEESTTTTRCCGGKR